METKLIWTPEMIQELAKELDYGIQLLYGPETGKTWDTVKKQWIPNKRTK